MPISPDEVYFAYTLKPKDQATYLNYIQQREAIPRVPI